MSKVTIESLYDDFTVQRKEAEYGINYELYAKLAEIEIIPRKIVEMIIECCDKIISDAIAEQAVNTVDSSEFTIATSVYHTAVTMKNYAESLLRQFEEGAEDNE